MHFLAHEQPGILKLLLLAALVSMFVAGTAVVGFPYLVRTVLGLSAQYYGIAESAMGIASILGSMCTAIMAKKTANTQSVCSVYHFWNMSHSVRPCFYNADRYICALFYTAYDVLSLSAWLQRFPRHMRFLLFRNARRMN